MGKDDFDAELTLVSNAPESPQRIKLTGEGINSIMVPPGTLLTASARQRVSRCWEVRC